MEAPSDAALAEAKSDRIQRKPGPVVSIDAEMFKDVQVGLSARLGQADLSVEELLALKAGSVVKLDLKINDLVELRLQDSLVARGEIVAVGDHFGIRIVEVGRIS